ncbi:MAG: alpha-1,2-fucosyltransferase [Candidatus Saccharimonadales bacterium]
MVITRLYGGLGNQMFQYAVGLVLADRLSTRLYMDLSWFEAIKGNANVAQRVYELDVFDIYPKQLGLLDKISIKLNSPISFKEQGLGYQKSFRNLRGNIILDGYWQSYKYLDRKRELVLEAFSFPEKISQKNLKIFSSIQKAESVSIHIRRGDYVQMKHTNIYHGVIPLSYYSQAIAYFESLLNGPVFYIFSDDPKWCRTNLKLRSPAVFVDNNRGQRSGVEDLRLMSACKHNIIANSSFSWWAAWLNSNPQKIVCSPKDWFAGTKHRIQDRIPKDWLII